jgi:hypothetical protein
MHHLSDDDRKLVLGEVLADQLDLILEYVKEIPTMKKELQEMHTKVDEIDTRLIVIEHVVKEHEKDIKQINFQLKMA